MRKLTLDEKIGQLSSNLFGWKAYANNGKDFTQYLFDELDKYGTIGSIYGILRSDPWSRVTYDNGIPEAESKKVLDSLSDILKGKTEIKPFFFEEMPHGHQGLDATCFPVNLAIGCTFNSKLYKKACSLGAAELRAKGANVGLLSCLDLALDPRWGRTEECYGEDTYLSSVLAKNAILGFQGESINIDNKHIAVVAKHFIGQGSALGGHNGGTVSIGKNELEAHHLPIMKACIEANVAGVMAAYNDLDSIPCHANKDLLVKTLREKMGFNGFVMSDGCAIDNLTRYLPTNAHAVAKAFSSGVNVDLWNVTFNSLKEAVEKKLISEEELDKSLGYVLGVKKRLGLVGNQSQSIHKVDKKELIETNYQLACESIVLLENDGILPLDNLNNTCLIGPFGDNIYHQLGDYTAFQNTDKVKSLKQELDIPFEIGTYPREYKEGLIKKAAALAKQNEVVILNIGSSSARDFSVKFDRNGAAIVDQNAVSFMDCGEGVDVAEIALSLEQERLFDEIYKVNKNIVVLITSGRPIGIEKIKGRARAIVQSFYGGQQIARAIKDTLVGKNNPSGRLSISVPKNSGQIPAYYWLKETNKYIDQTNEPTYTFGSGKSYSDISMKLTKVDFIDKNKYTVSVEIENKSKVDAKWPILLFAKISDTKIKPPKKQLVSFEKVAIGAHKSKTVKLNVDLEWLWNNYKFKNIEFEAK